MQEVGIISEGLRCSRSQSGWFGLSLDSLERNVEGTLLEHLQHKVSEENALFDVHERETFCTPTNLI